VINHGILIGIGMVQWLDVPPKVKKFMYWIQDKPMLHKFLMLIKVAKDKK